MATSTPTSSTPTSNADVEATRQLYRKLAICTVVACPVIALLPPRKIDLYTALLGATTFIAGNHLSQDYTGLSLLQLARYKAVSGVAAATAPPTTRAKALHEEEDEGVSLPTEKAREMRRLFRQQKEREAALMREKEAQAAAEGETTKAIKEKLAEVADDAAATPQKRGIVQRIWMGQESDDWKAKRDQKELEALEEGKGYGDLIMDQIWEVVSWGKKSDDEEK